MTANTRVVEPVTVVDDDPDMLKAIGRLLAARGIG
jgi:FixJ family two-component response regulator